MRVVIGEDSALFREGLKRLLVENEIEVVGEASDLPSVLTEVHNQQPDVAVMDIRLPPTNTDEGVRAAEEIFVTAPDVGVLVLSQVVDARFATRLLEGRTTGIGYLLKDRVVDLGAFISAIKTVGARGSVIDPEVVTQLVQRERDKGPLHLLSERETNVLTLMARGMSNAAIGGELFLSERTVESHVATVFRKLNIDSGTESNRRVLAVLAYLRAT
ncbi:MAG: response regulator transcription factor [Actinomycetota bacterium]|nr:response regulator transcription factor [Actinomycetota bacterium]